MSDRIPGRATPEGTATYAARFPEASAGHFRRARGLMLSSIGLGTYLGRDDDEGDRLYTDAVLACLSGGVNVLDTAISYRNMRSERAVGQGVARAVEEARVKREEVFLVTKGGFLPFDKHLPDDPRGYLYRTYFETGLVSPEALAHGCQTIAPGYLQDQIKRSLRNLGVDTIDAYLLHNPEMQYEEFSRDVVDARFVNAFETLEREVDAGRIARYGVATWNGFRVPPEVRGHLGLEALLGFARAARARVDGQAESHHFAAIELPVNLSMPEALVVPTQPCRGRNVPLLEVARENALIVLTSASILQGRLAKGLPEDARAALGGRDVTTDAQRALQFTRSLPGVTSALVGMMQPAHVNENLAVARAPVASPDVVSAFRA